MRHVVLAGLAALAVLGAGCDEAGFDHGPRQRQSISETRALGLDGTFRLENTNGEVEVHTWRQPQVKIEAEKAGSRWMVEHTRIEIRGQGDRVTVETRQPRQGWFFGSGGKVDYRVTVP